MIEEIKSIWSIDSKINKTKLDEESLHSSVLHSKYFNLYLKYNRDRRNTKKQYYDMVSIKKQYYLGTMDKDELKEKGWIPFGLKVTNTTLQSYIDSDKDVIDISLKLGEYDDIIEFLKSILDNISKRGFQIKNAIDFIKFQNGIS